MLALGGEDTHKSLGNDVSLRNVLDTWGREATLVFFLTGHWHGPIDFSDEAMKSARARADGFREVFRDLHEPRPDGAWGPATVALEDDFNTPAALAVMTSGGTSCSRGGRSRSSASAPSPWRRRRRPTSSSSPAGCARAARDFEEADRIREELEAVGWEARDEDGGYRPVPS